MDETQKSVQTTGQPEVRTRALTTAAALVMLGNEPIAIQTDVTGALFRFAPSAESDLKRFLVAKQAVERMIAGARRQG